MPRVMMLGSSVPRAGGYRPPPGIVVHSPSLVGLGRINHVGGRRRIGGLGTMQEICDDPATAFIQTGLEIFRSASASGCTQVTRDGRRVAQDEGWCAASRGTQAGNTAFDRNCTRVREAAQAEADANDPTEMSSLRAQLDLERQRSDMLLQTRNVGATESAERDYTPWLVGGAVGLGVIGLVLLMKR